LIYSTYGTAIKNSEGKDGSREKEGEERVTDRFLRRNNTMTNVGQALGFSPSLLLSFAFSSSYCEYETAAAVAPQGNKGLGFFWYEGEKAPVLLL
jgi:hypothetical protein